MDWKRIAPWNWFRKEQERDRSAVPVSRSGDPFEALQREMDRRFETLLRGLAAGSPAPGWPRLPSLEEAAPLLRPSLDISEGRKAYTLKVEVPGVEKDDVELQVEGDTLLIRGEKRQESEESDEDYHCIERSYGRFERMLSLPDDADPDAISAKFGNGVLKVSIPKRAVPDTERRAIEIRHD